jgi:nitrogenase subunit NifH
MASSTNLLAHRFLFVVGKGGVGKTTVGTAIALAAAKQGKRVLLAMCNAKERVSSLLGVAPIGSQNVNVLPNLDVVNMVPRDALAHAVPGRVREPGGLGAPAGNTRDRGLVDARQGLLPHEGRP